MPAIILLAVLVPLPRLPRLAKETEHAGLLLLTVARIPIFQTMAHPLVVLVSTRHVMPMKHAFFLLG